MPKIFSFINIVIIIGLTFLAYLGYSEYLDNKVKQNLSKTNSQIKQIDSESTAVQNATTTKQTEIKTAPSPAPASAKTTATAEKKGYYINNTYFYEIHFPESWPIKIRSEANISVGTVPPKNGQGAITIEISQGGGDSELEQAEAEAKKYPGIISISNQPIFLAGISGDKIIVNNSITKLKTINIILKKSNLNYILKYSEESPEFTAEAEKALATFKFTR